MTSFDTSLDFGTIRRRKTKTRNSIVHIKADSKKYDFDTDSCDEAIDVTNYDDFPDSPPEVQLNLQDLLLLHSEISDKENVEDVDLGYGSSSSLNVFDHSHSSFRVTDSIPLVDQSVFFSNSPPHYGSTNYSPTVECEKKVSKPKRFDELLNLGEVLKKSLVISCEKLDLDDFCKKNRYVKRDAETVLMVPQPLAENKNVVDAEARLNTAASDLILSRTLPSLPTSKIIFGTVSGDNAAHLSNKLVKSKSVENPVKITKLFDFKTLSNKQILPGIVQAKTTYTPHKVMLGKTLTHVQHITNSLLTKSQNKFLIKPVEKLTPKLVVERTPPIVPPITQNLLNDINLCDLEGLLSEQDISAILPNTVFSQTALDTPQCDNVNKRPSCPVSGDGNIIRKVSNDNVIESVEDYALHNRAQIIPRFEESERVIPKNVHVTSEPEESERVIPKNVHVTSEPENLGDLTSKGPNNVNEHVIVDDDNAIVDDNDAIVDNNDVIVDDSDDDDDDFLDFQSSSPVIEPNSSFDIIKEMESVMLSAKPTIVDKPFQKSLFGGFANMIQTGVSSHKTSSQKQEQKEPFSSEKVLGSRDFECSRYNAELDDLLFGSSFSSFDFSDEVEIVDVVEHSEPHDTEICADVVSVPHTEHEHISLNLPHRSSFENRKTKKSSRCSDKLEDFSSLDDSFEMVKIKPDLDALSSPKKITLKIGRKVQKNKMSFSILGGTTDSDFDVKRALDSESDTKHNKLNKAVGKKKSCDVEPQSIVSKIKMEPTEKSLFLTLSSKSRKKKYKSAMNVDPINDHSLQSDFDSRSNVLPEPAVEKKSKSKLLKSRKKQPVKGLSVKKKKKGKCIKPKISLSFLRRPNKSSISFPWSRRKNIPSVYKTKTKSLVVPQMASKEIVDVQVPIVKSTFKGAESNDQVESRVIEENGDALQADTNDVTGNDALTKSSATSEISRVETSIGGTNGNHSSDLLDNVKTPSVNPEKAVNSEPSSVESKNMDTPSNVECLLEETGSGKDDNTICDMDVDKSSDEKVSPEETLKIEQAILENLPPSTLDKSQIEKLLEMDATMVSSEPNKASDASVITYSEDTLDTKSKNDTGSEIVKKSKRGRKPKSAPVEDNMKRYQRTSDDVVKDNISCSTSEVSSSKSEKSAESKEHKSADGSEIKSSAVEDREKNKPENSKFSREEVSTSPINIVKTNMCSTAGEILKTIIENRKGEFVEEKNTSCDSKNEMKVKSSKSESHSTKSAVINKNADKGKSSNNTEKRVMLKEQTEESSKKPKISSDEEIDVTTVSPKADVQVSSSESSEVKAKEEPLDDQELEQLSLQALKRTPRNKVPKKRYSPTDEIKQGRKTSATPGEGKSNSRKSSSIFTEESTPTIKVSKSSEATPSSSRKKYNPEDVIKPFSNGWMREVVHRAVSQNAKSGRRAIDVYYFTPEGAKLRSMPDVSKYLAEHKNSGLTINNFTFCKETIYRQPFENERGARMRLGDDATPPVSISASTKKSSTKSSTKHKSEADSTTPKQPKLSKSLFGGTPKSSKSLDSNKTSDISKSGNKLSDGHRSGNKLLDGSKNSNKLSDESKNGSKLSDESKNGNKLSDGSKNVKASDGSKVSMKTARKSFKSIIVGKKSDQDAAVLPSKSLEESTPLPTPSEDIDQDVQQLRVSSTSSDKAVRKTYSKRPFEDTSDGGPLTKKLKVTTSKKLIPVSTPCTSRCPAALHQIPTLQCGICLCMFHLQCVPGQKHAANFVCLSCRLKKPSIDSPEHDSDNNFADSVSLPSMLPEVSMHLYSESDSRKSVLHKNISNLPPPPPLQRAPERKKATFTIPAGTSMKISVSPIGSHAESLPSNIPVITVMSSTTSSTSSPLSNLASLTKSVVPFPGMSQARPVPGVPVSYKMINQPQNPFFMFPHQPPGFMARAFTAPSTGSSVPVSVSPSFNTRHRFVYQTNAPSQDVLRPLLPNTDINRFPLTFRPVRPQGGIVCTSVPMMAPQVRHAKHPMMMMMLMSPVPNQTSSTTETAVSTAPITTDSSLLSPVTTKTESVSANVSESSSKSSINMSLLKAALATSLDNPSVPTSLSVSGESRNSSNAEAVPSTECLSNSEISSKNQTSPEKLFTSTNGGKSSVHQPMETTKMYGKKPLIYVSSDSSDSSSSETETSSTESASDSSSITQNKEKSKKPIKKKIIIKPKKKLTKVKKINPKYSSSDDDEDLVESKKSNKKPPVQKTVKVSSKAVSCNILPSVPCQAMVPAYLDLSSFTKGYECLNLIFKQLKVHDLLHVAQVSHSWQHLATQQFLWQQVSLQGLYVSNWLRCTEALKRCGTRILNLRGVQLTENIEDIPSPNVWKDFLLSLKNLEAFEHITFGQVPPSVLEAVADTCTLLQCLECYCLTTTYVRPDLWITPCTLKFFNFRFLKKLRRLKIRSAGGLYMPEEPSDIRYLTELQHLSLTSLKDFPSSYFNFLSHLHNLVTLELGDCSLWTKENYKVLGKLSKLQQLRLENGGGFDIGLADALCLLTDLVDLELMKFIIPENLGEAIENLSYLTHLSLWPDNSDGLLAARINLNTFRSASKAQQVSYFCWGIISPDDCIPLLPILKEPSEMGKAERSDKREGKLSDIDMEEGQQSDTDMDKDKMLDDEHEKSADKDMKEGKSSDKDTKNRKSSNRDKKEGKSSDKDKKEGQLSEKDKKEGKSSNKDTDEGKSSNKKEDKLSDKKQDKSSDKKQEKSPDKKEEKSSDKKEEKSSDKKAEKSSDKKEEKSADKDKKGRKLSGKDKKEGKSSDKDKKKLSEKNKEQEDEEMDEFYEDVHYEDLFERLCSTMPDAKVEMKCISEDFLNEYCSIQR